MLPQVTFSQDIDFFIALDDSTKKPVGRPSIDPAYRLATQAWFIAVSHASSGLNAPELEELFRPKKFSTKEAVSKTTSGIWGKYRDGRICPKVLRDCNGRPSIVERVEKKFKDTAQWLVHPFWRVLGYEPLSMNALKEIYLQLPMQISDLLIVETHNRMFWRRPGNIERAYEGLAGMGNLASFTAVLALIKECETTQNQEMHKVGLRYWAMCSHQLRSDPVLSSLVDNMNKIIEDRYRTISYVSSDGNYYRLPIGVIRSTIKSNGAFNLISDDEDENDGE